MNTAKMSACVVWMLILAWVSHEAFCLNPQDHILETDDFPQDDRFRPAIGNGHIATNVLSDTIYMNGVFNGRRSDSHRARIPATSSIDAIDRGHNSSRHYSLDMLRGIFTQTIKRDDADIAIQYFAHRTMTRLLVTIVTMTRRRQGVITLNLTINRGEDSNDLTRSIPNITRGSDRREYMARTKIPEVDEGQRTRVFQFWTHVPDLLVLKPDNANMSSVFITAISTDLEDALHAYNIAMAMSSDTLLVTHAEAWRKVWEEGHLEVNGNQDVALSLNAGLYYILSSIPLSRDPLNPFMGLSPGTFSIPLGQGQCQLNQSVVLIGVMGPDEYHYNVNNSVFTNYNAKLSLELPAYIRDTYNPYLSETEQGEIDTFSHIAKNMLILFDEKKQFHPQFEGFALNESIKQSDVVLLGFPLLMSMPRNVRRNDLVIYEKLTDRVGPDTGTWSMHSLTRLELNEKEAAADDFRMMFRNINGPFKIFSEKPASNPSGIRCVNFITAAGGLLQTAIFGYAGIRYRNHHLDIRPRLLPNSTDWAVRGLHYQGFTVDVEIFQNMFKLTLVKDRRDKEICLSNKNEACEILKLRKSVTKPQQKFKIFIRDPRVGTATLALRIQPSVLLQLSLLLPLVTVFTL
ncbi:protein-glucosylgalactosylhydroxylysine glucosidase-like [Haliotis rufescens]|uniref:protein-glucosylgalactosylhydroxylysine glucosidase-like n=1 Tax=Haliotis rufescens TaxID=6454 RepID=UPI00201EAFE0|nr:protein-glucosylgalactosylhydroxylysine glucosidase-like [Haliotis rufescens]